MAATDFFTIVVWTLRSLVIHYVLFVIHLATRKIPIAGANPNPTGAFMLQVARNPTDEFDEFLRIHSHLWSWTGTRSLQRLSVTRLSETA